MNSSIKPNKATNPSTRHSITTNIKRSLMVPANYHLLLGTTLILRTMHADSVQYVQDAAKHGYIVKFLTLKQSYQRAQNTLHPKQFHAYCHETGVRTKAYCFQLISQMIDHFYSDAILYSAQTGIPAKELSTPSLHIKQLAYLSHYLTYKLEGKPRIQSPLAVMRNKLAYKREPIQQRIERKAQKPNTVSTSHNKSGTISNQYQQELPLSTQYPKT